MGCQNILQIRMISWHCLRLLCLLILAAPLKAEAMPRPVAISLAVAQAFTNNSTPADVNDTISYELLSLAPENPMPADSTGAVYSFTITGTNSTEINPLTFHNAGIYLYEIRMQRTSPLPGYHYDTQVYQLQFFVKQTGAALSAEVIAEKSDGSKADGITFEHSYTPLASNPALMTALRVRKTVSGALPQKAFTFAFTLTARDKANPMPPGSTEGVHKIFITGSGEVVFEAWSYTREGTYFYEVAEANGHSASYTYDESVYTVTDVVKDVNGQLEVTRTVTNEWNKQVSACLFINQYQQKQKDSDDSNDGNSKHILEFPADDESMEYLESDGGDQTGSEAGIYIDIPKVGDESSYELNIILCLLSAVVCTGCLLLLIPNMKSTRKVKPIMLFLSISVCLMLFSGYQLWGNIRSYKAGNQSYEKLKQQVRYQMREDVDDLHESVTPQLDIPRLDIDFNALKELNTDAAAWLYSPDTAIDYPVMTADDYNWYLHHLPDGTVNPNGSLFLDYNNPENFSSRLNIIYGHQMKSGKMFGSLKGYKRQAYFDRHPSLYLYTEQTNYRIDLLYGCVIAAGVWREQAFMYEVNLEALLDYAASLTTFKSNAEYTDDDTFIVLATCSYEFEDARYIVIGILRSDVK